MAKSLVKWDADGVAQWAANAPKEGAVLVHSLRGFLDAGKAGAIVAEHLRGLDSVKLASFDIDALLDYRSRRPEMTFSVNEWTAYDEPHLDLDMVRDAAGTPFLLLHGFEPDLKWERYYPLGAKHRGEAWRWPHARRARHPYGFAAHTPHFRDGAWHAPRTDARFP